MNRSMLRSRHAAFTLVELLVVIGIIAVLISILLPALNRSRAQAKVVQCASLMRQIIIATRAYAAENKDYLPQMPLDNGQPNFSANDKFVTGVTTILTARAFTHPYNTYSTVEPAGKEEGANIGRLVFRGYLKGSLAKMTVCPNNADQDGLGYGGYMYNPHLAIRMINGVEYQGTWWKKASQFGRAKGTYNVRQLISPYGSPTGYAYPGKMWALVTDPLLMPSTGSVQGFLPHVVGRSYVMNLAQVDGSVTPIYTSKSRGNTVSYGQYLDLLTFDELLGSGNANSQFPNNPASCIPINP